MFLPMCVLEVISLLIFLLIHHFAIALEHLSLVNQDYEIIGKSLEKFHWYFLGRYFKG